VAAINKSFPRTNANSARLGLWPLVIATFFMVSGGTYGTEDIVRGAGYFGGILILIVTPLIWSLPTALMIGELSSAIPAEGGFYVWVRRAMGNFWGFQEAWLSLVASIFDMAIYPALFVAYLGRLYPSLVAGHRDLLIGIAVVIVCAALNLAGIRVVAITSVWLFFLLSSPFIAITILAVLKPGSLAHVPAPPTASHIGIVAGLLVAMWNYMGWDNASTIAGEVAQPQRTYPRAMLTAVALVALSYIIPIAAMSLTKLSPSAWETGSWADIAAMMGGPALRIALVAGGMMSAFGMFNALVLSYSRLPYAMAVDGMLPSIFAKTTRRTNVPWLSVVVLSIAWAACLGLGFERLVTIDILVYGGSLLLEFVALAVLRLTEPDMPRPFRVPGGTLGAVLVGILPALLLGFAIFESESERILGMNALVFGIILIIAGFAAYAMKTLLMRNGSVSVN
jgi:amino acid transporter